MQMKISPSKNNSSYIHPHTVSRLTIKQKQAQSALEYMMTYGWAILIIVIVAVILYSMGIFNPSSSLTATSTGFSPFIVSSAVCSSGGLSLAVQAGPLPNLATSVTLQKVYVISSSGTNSLNRGYNISPVTLTSGHSAVLRLPIVCSSSGTKFSLLSNLEYSYSTSAGNVIINATGTLLGTSSSSNKVAEFSSSAPSYINISHSYPGQTRLTMVVWSNEFGGTGTEFTSMCCAWRLFGDPSGSQFIIDPGYPNNQDIAVSTNYNKWYMLSFSAYSSGSNIYYSAYINATEVGSGTTSGPIAYIPYMMFGDQSNCITAGCAFDGELSNGQVYSDNLSQQQIKTLYLEGIHGGPILNAGLIGWWPLDGNANDYSGNNNNGVAASVQWVSP